MTDSPELPPRPQPPRRWSDSLHAWLAWFGLGRLLVSAVCVVAVVAGVAWLVRTPAPPTEAGLPVSGGATSTQSVSTLAPPTTRATRSSEVGAGRPATSVFVHVAGAVVGPGVYELAGAARVQDAIEAAGGPTGDADLDGLNLAAPLADGQRVYVPVGGEIDPASIPAGGGSAAGSEVAGDAAGPIDLNTATVEQLEGLPGVGPATAAAIVDDRERHGPFASVAELERVAGIGPAKLAAVVELVTV